MLCATWCHKNFHHLYCRYTVTAASVITVTWSMCYWYGSSAPVCVHVPILKANTLNSRRI